jgi:hypothetical protein
MDYQAALSLGLPLGIGIAAIFLLLPVIRNMKKISI